MILGGVKSRETVNKHLPDGMLGFFPHGRLFYRNRDKRVADVNTGDAIDVKDFLQQRVVCWRSDKIERDR
jgi:hypothetical protein